MEYTEEEKSFIPQYLAGLTNLRLGEFLQRHGLKRSGTKEELLRRMTDGLKDGTLQYAQVLRFLDQVDLWGKQHVYLYGGAPSRILTDWADPGKSAKLKKVKEIGDKVNQNLPLILPATPTIKSVRLTAQSLAIIQIERRENWIPAPEFDDTLIVEGQEIVRRAFRRSLNRAITMFHWNFAKNVARLQISQQPSGTSYEGMRDDFGTRVSSWFPFDVFEMIDLQPALYKIHNQPPSRAVSRTQAMGMKTADGYSVELRSPSQDHALADNTTVETTVREVQRTGISRKGNFYWLSKDLAPWNNNPLTADIRTAVVASKGRINFTTDNGKEGVLYVLARIRDLC